MTRRERFDAWKRQPGPSTLVALLETTQGRVFAICREVLRLREDAEEAAQETLLKVVEGIDQVSDADHFERWIGLVATRAAIDRKRMLNRSRVRDLAGAALSRDSSRPVDGIQDALAKLPEEDRDLIVERYFERRTLEEMARRRGVSDVAVRKRIKKAHGRLKRMLGSAFALGIGVMKAKAAVAIILVSLLLLGGGIWVLSGGRGSQDSLVAAARKSDHDSDPKNTSDPTSVPSKTPKADIAAVRTACRGALSRALLAKNFFAMSMAMDVMRLHRSNREFQSMADTFCFQAGEDLVPICREILADCGSEPSSALIAAILGHSRRADAFDLLKELIVKGQGPPQAKSLFASAVYSMGMIRSDLNVPYLLKLYGQMPEAQASLAGQFGSPLMAAIGLCGKQGVAALRQSAMNDLDPEFQPDPDEGLRRFRWSHLAMVSSPEAFADLRTIAEGDSDIRLRGMAIAAMGQSPDPGQRAYLAELYLRDNTQYIRRAVVEALMDGFEATEIESSTMREQLAGPLASIINSTRLPSGYEYLDHAVIRLASMSNTPEAVRFVEDWVRSASNGIYERDSFWIDIALDALSKQGVPLKRINDLLEEQAVSPEDRLYHLASLQIRSATSFYSPELVRALIADVEGRREDPARVHNFLVALGRMPEANDEVSAFIDRLISRSPDNRSKIEAIDTALYAGKSGMRPLENVLQKTGELPVLLHAARSYLNLVPEGAHLDPAIGDRIRNLFSAQSLREFSSEALGTGHYTGSVFTRTLGLYFSRYGTVEDLQLLEVIPTSMGTPESIRPASLTQYRADLAWECARAADAIRLRSN